MDLQTLNNLRTAALLRKVAEDLGVSKPEFSDHRTRGEMREEAKTRFKQFLKDIIENKDNTRDNLLAGIKQSAEVIAPRVVGGAAFDYLSDYIIPEVFSRTMDAYTRPVDYSDIRSLPTVLLKNLEHPKLPIPKAIQSYFENPDIRNNYTDWYYDRLKRKYPGYFNQQYNQLEP